MHACDRSGSNLPCASVLPAPKSRRSSREEARRVQHAGKPRAAVGGGGASDGDAESAWWWDGKLSAIERSCRARVRALARVVLQVLEEELRYLKRAEALLRRGDTASSAQLQYSY